MTLYHSTGIIAASGGAAAKPGMVLLKPTSIAHSGTSASIGANGQVTFTAVTSLSLNGVFSATYDNYFVSISDDPAAILNSYIRFRTAGTDATGVNYTYQYLIASGTSVLVARGGDNKTLVGNQATTQNGMNFFIYGPALAQPTAMRSLQVSSGDGAMIYDLAHTHSLSTSYDGFTYFVNTSSLTGTIAVYGIRS